MENDFFGSPGIATELSSEFDEPFDSLGVIPFEEQAVSAVKGSHLLHLLVIKTEVENVKALLHSLLVKCASPLGSPSA